MTGHFIVFIQQFILLSASVCYVIASSDVFHDTSFMGIYDNWGTAVCSIIIM